MNNMTNASADEFTAQRAAIVPVVGMGVTVCHWTDSQAYTIVSVSKSGRMITLVRDVATLLNGTQSGEPDALQFSPGGFFGHTSGKQRYSYAPGNVKTSQVSKATLRKDGIWRESITNNRVLIGERSEYYDFNF